MTSHSETDEIDENLMLRLRDNLRQAMASLLSAATSTDARDWAQLQNDIRDTQERCAQVVHVVDLIEWCVRPLPHFENRDDIDVRLSAKLFLGDC
jgi:DNA repair ATPase RecN